MGIFSKIKRALTVFHPSKSDFCSIGKNSIIEFPVYISWPKSVSIEENVRVRQGTKILISEFSQLHIKQYSVIGMNNMIIPNKHKSTVGVPQFLLGTSGVNDEHNDIVIEEDVWTGSNVTLMGNVKLGRGCLCGACCVVTKPVPPYAVVVGSPAKIVAVKFSIEQILEHEKILYPEHERYSREFLEELFEKSYKDVRVFGENIVFSEENISKLKRAAEFQNFTKSDYFDQLKSFK